MNELNELELNKDAENIKAKMLLSKRRLAL